MIPNCPKCNSEYTYEDGSLVVCPECAYEWNPEFEVDENVVKDVNGNILSDGDSVIVIKDVKVKGSPTDIKKGTKIKNIKINLNNSNGFHDVDCKVDGIGKIEITSKYLKKA